MSLLVLPDVEQRSEAWYDQRRGMVTASVVGQLITAKTLQPASDEQPKPATLTPEQIAACTDTDTLRDWWHEHPGLRPLIEARVTELGPPPAHDGEVA